MRFRIASQETVILVEGIGGDQVCGVDSARVLPQLFIRSLMVICRRRAGRVERQGSSAKIDQDILRCGTLPNHLAELVELGQGGVLAD